MGGKSFSGTGGNLPDFLYENKMTKNLAIVEIKTQKTQLLGQSYRGNSYSMSKGFSAAISQVLSYRQSLLNEFNSIYVNSGGVSMLTLEGMPRPSLPAALLCLGTQMSFKQTGRRWGHSRTSVPASME